MPGTEERVWIPMSDGVRLSATLILPDAADGAQPCVLEANPYRQDDVTESYFGEYRRLRDEAGYAVARVDLRGTGSSEGLIEDEYSFQEQIDLGEAISWLASREWCDGNVGMYGSSYSGFNCIQVAMERPPALKAIIPVYATDDRYTDDVHYYGGTRRALDILDYPLYMVAMNALPPLPSLAGERWREAWRDRVEGHEPWMLRWLEEQLDAPYWRHGSLRPDYDRIACPVMIVAGWADGYRNATFRMFERLRVPKRLLIGPWSHTSPEIGLPGPHIDLVPEMIRWWDRWLRGRENGLDIEAPISVFVRRPTRPAFDVAKVRGEWRSEPAWPPERQREVALALGGGGRMDLEVRPDTGSSASMWCAGHLPFGQPMDQRPDEAVSLVFDWPAVEREIMGYPRVEVALASSAPVAFLSAKLCDVFPDGTSALVSRGFLNLTHRDSQSNPTPLTPEEVYRVTVPMDATAWIFEPGHRVRLDLAGADWPNLWPPPEAVTLTIHPNQSRLILPVIEGPSPVRSRPDFAPPTHSNASQEGDPSAGSGARGTADLSTVVYRHELDPLRRETRVVFAHGSETALPGGARSIERYDGTVGVSTGEPGSAWARGTAAFRLEWPEATVESEVSGELRSDASSWDLTLELRVREGGDERWTRRWERRFPRHLG